MLKNKIKTVLQAAQANTSCHQQKIKVLVKYFNEASLEDFFDSIKGFLTLMFSKNTISDQNIYIERSLEFMAQFVAEVTPVDYNEDVLSEVSSHPFLTMMIKETLKYHDLVNENVRYNSCLFVKLILQHIGNDKNLDNEVCDMIQDAMLESTLDPKSAVRLQSVLALIRLQEPLNPECPVIRAYLSLIVDPNNQIRTEVVKSIAPNIITIPQIISRLRDTDHIVRMAAFRRCADIGPVNIKIVERQHILNCGLSENNSKVKNVFIDNLLPNWLQAYGGDYIKFMKGLKLDGDENDLNNTENLTKNIIRLLLNITPIKDIISILPLTEEKIIPADKLTSEAAALWNIIVCFLRETDTNEDILEQIIPDLTPFSIYIKSIITEQGSNKMEDWEFLDYQFILNNLFALSEGYDLADEVGRRTLHQITLEVLRTENLQMTLKKHVVQLAYKTSQKTDDFTNTICHIISDIQESFIDKSVEMSLDEERNRECQKAALRVKIIQNEADLEQAQEDKDFLKANAFKTNIGQLQDKLNELSIPKPTVEKVKVTKDDPKTVCDCLDLLISLLLLPSISSMTPSLLAIKDEFVVPLLNSNLSEINWRVLECIVLFCCLEQALAEEYIKVICMPIITYRKIPNYNRNALMISVKAVSDLFRLYGANIFGIMEEALSSNQSMNTTTSTKRRLYRSEDSDESVLLANRFHLETIIEIILDMLDDEISEIRNTALEAMAKLILDNFPVSPLLITRLVLKWYNPLTARSSDRLEQLIGVIIGNYAKKNEEAKEVIAKAVKPILHSIASAPRTSPLADVDVDNLILFLSTITKSGGKWDTGTHLNMAHMCTNEILKSKNPLMVLYLSKMLLHLDILTENVAVMKELIAQVDAIIESETPMERNSKRNLCKFREILGTRLENLNKTKDTNSETTDGSVSEEKENEASLGNLNQRKRKIPNNEKTINKLLSIVEEDDSVLEKSKNNEEINNSITNNAKRSKTNTELTNKSNTDSSNNSNTDSQNKNHTDSQNKSHTDSQNKSHTDNRNKSNTDSSNNSNTDSQNKSNTNTDSSIANSNLKRSDSEAQQSESSGVKKPSKLKKKRNRKLRDPQSTEQSSSSADDENQPVVKRVKVIVHQIDIVTGDEEVEVVDKNLQVRVEPLKENGNEIELSKSTSDADVISASSNSQELNIASKFSKRKRNVKRNKTKSIGKATSDSDSGNIRPKRINRGTNNNVDSDEDIPVVSSNGGVSSKGSETDGLSNVKQLEDEDIAEVLSNESVGSKESGKKEKDSRSNVEQLGDKDIAALSSNRRGGRKGSDKKNKDNTEVSFNGRGRRKESDKKEKNASSNVGQRVSKQLKDIAKVSSNERIVRKESNKKKKKDGQSNGERVSKELKDIAVVSSNRRGRRKESDKEKDGRSNGEQRVSKQLEDKHIAVVLEHKDIVVLSPIRRKRKENDKKEKDDRSNVERFKPDVKKNAVNTNIVISDKNRLKENGAMSNLRSDSKMRKSTSRELIETETTIEKNGPGRKMVLRKSVSSKSTDPEETSNLSQDFEDVLNTPSSSTMSRISTRSRSQTTPVPKNKLNTSSSSFKTDKGKRCTRTVKKKKT